MAEKAQTLPPDTQLFRDIFTASPVGIAVENLEGRPLFVNPTLCSMFGFSEEEMCNKHFLQFSPPEDAQKDRALFQQLRAGSIDYYQLEKRYFRRDGSMFWGRLSISLLKGRPFPLVVARVEDITENKKAEEARFRHAAIVESSEDAILSVTLDGVIVSWNIGAQRIFGYTENEAVGKSVTIIVPPELPDEENTIFETLRAGGRIEHFETVRVSKTGKRIDVSLSISPIKDSTGKTVGYAGIERDITKRKGYEMALRTSEERLRLAQQAASIGTFEWNIQTGVNTWAPELEAIYGLPLGGFGRTQTAFENLVHPDDRAAVIKLVDYGLKTGLPTRGEWRVVWPDGSVHWISGRWQVFMDPSGKPSRMIGVNGDITERKLAEQRLREYERAVEASGEMITVIDREYRCLMANREYLNRRNATREQVVGHFAYELVDQRVFEDVLKPKLDECFRGNVVKFELKYTYPELGERDLSISYYPIEGPDGIDRVACLLLDITDRKQAEHALSESEQRFRLATQAGRMYAFEWNVASDTIVRSGDVAGVLGPTGETELKRHQLRESIHPDDRGQFTTSMRETSPENPDVQMSYRLLRPDGSVAWLEKIAHAFFDEQGRMVRMVGMVADVTERKRAEEVLSDVNRRLLQAQEQERVRIARELHDDISQRVALLAVELEQLREHSHELPSEIRHRIENLKNETTGIATDVQILSHELHSSKLDYLGVVAGMKSWCTEFAARQTMQIDFKDRDVPVDLPSEISFCLFRVLQEALQNAVKHSGVKRVDVELTGTPDEIRLTASDVGKGFDIEAASQGEGLGLTSMRERVRLVNGTIVIESKPMGGTTIDVRVPFESQVASQRAS